MTQPWFQRQTNIDEGERGAVLLMYRCSGRIWRWATIFLSVLSTIVDRSVWENLDRDRTIRTKYCISNFFLCTQAAKKEVKKNWQGKGGKGEIIPIFDKNLYRKLKGYIEYCTKFSWRIVTQAPPLKIAYETSPFNPCDHTESQAFASSSLHSSHERWVDSQKRKEIKCFVWPTLRDCDNRVIEKGHVVLMEHTPHVTFL